MILEIYTPSNEYNHDWQVKLNSASCLLLTERADTIFNGERWRRAMMNFGIEYFELNLSFIQEEQWYFEPNLYIQFIWDNEILIRLRVILVCYNRPEIKIDWLSQIMRYSIIKGLISTSCLSLLCTTFFIDNTFCDALAYTKHALIVTKRHMPAF